MEKQRGQDLGQKKTMFFHPKIPKICVTWVKSEKGSNSYPQWPMFKISWKNCEPSQKYGPKKISREERKKEEEEWRKKEESKKKKKKEKRKKEKRKKEKRKLTDWE